MGTDLDNEDAIKVSIECCASRCSDGRWSLCTGWGGNFLVKEEAAYRGIWKRFRERRDLAEPEDPMLLEAIIAEQRTRRPRHPIRSMEGTPDAQADAIQQTLALDA